LINVGSSSSNTKFALDTGSAVAVLDVTEPPDEDIVDVVEIVVVANVDPAGNKAGSRSKSNASRSSHPAALHAPSNASSLFFFFTFAFSASVDISEHENAAARAISQSRWNSVMSDDAISCEQCALKFTRKANLRRHIAQVHDVRRSKQAVWWWSPPNQVLQCDLLARFDRIVASALTLVLAG
jgi:hypothetical protein